MESWLFHFSPVWEHFDDSAVDVFELRVEIVSNIPDGPERLVEVVRRPQRRVVAHEVGVADGAEPFVVQHVIDALFIKIKPRKILSASDAWKKKSPLGTSVSLLAFEWGEGATWLLERARTQHETRASKCGRRRTWA